MRKAFGLVLVALFSITLAVGEDFTIQTFAGGGFPQNIPGTSAVLHGTGGLVLDASGNAFFTLYLSHIVLRLDPSGVLTLIAGNGTPGFSGDGGLAISAQLNQPWGIAIDAAGSLYIADLGNARIRKVQNGVISTVAGGGDQRADNVPATSALLINPRYVAADAAGNIYVEDTEPPPLGDPNAICCRIRKVTNGVITTIAGNGTFGYSGDGGPATSAQLAGPGAMAIDAAGTLYVSDAGTIDVGILPPPGYANLRKVQNGVITTVVPKIAPTTLAVSPAGNIFMQNTNLIQEISNGVITNITGVLLPTVGGSIGDNGPAIDAYVSIVNGLSVDKAGNIFLTSSELSGNSGYPVIGDLIRKISNGVITTIAGSATGTGISTGDNGPPLNAQLFFANDNSSPIPGGVAMDAAGNVYIAELNRVRKISQGVVTTVAGTGVAGFSGDNGPAADAQLNSPSGIGLDAAGNLFIADQGNVRVRKVSNGIITTIAGNGTFGYSGDGGPATDAKLGFGSLAVSPGGDVYVSDYYVAQVVRKISNGTIVTVAGNGPNGTGGDHGPAIDGQLFGPTGLALDGDGNLYIAEMSGNRIRKVSNGIITTVAGNLSSGSSGGDGGPAMLASLDTPTAVAVDDLGRLYIGENARVRLVSNGIITTVAGNGVHAYGGDGGEATSASISPVGLAIGPNGQVYEADLLPSRIRVLTPVAVPGVSFSANPSPIPVTAGNTEGKTTLTWSAPGHSKLQIFANGILFSNVRSSGSVVTGNWVNDGMNFSLVDPATGAPLSTTTVHTIASSSQVAFTANPNPIPLAAGAPFGETTLSWDAPGYSRLQIWVAGVLFAAGLPASGSVDTGAWVSDGLPFSLVDPASGQTLSTLTVHTAATAGQVTFSANPNPIVLAPGTTVGQTTLSWNAPGYNGLQIWVAGVLFAAGRPASGSVQTGDWVSNEMTFSLVNPINGQTIATATVIAK